MVDKNEALAAEMRLVLSALDANLTRLHKAITAKAAAELSLKSGGTIKKLIRELVEEMERTATILIAAYAKAGHRSPDDVATQVQSAMKPLAETYLASCKRSLSTLVAVFDHITPQVDRFFDSLQDRATVALAEYPGTTDEVIASLRPEKLPATWDRVQRGLHKARVQLSRARDAEDFQTVGLFCREVLISAAQAVYDRDRHPLIDDVTPSATDAKRQLDAFFMAELPGASNESMRKHARGAVQLADVLVHARTPTVLLGSLALEATSSVVSLLAIVVVNS